MIFQYLLLFPLRKATMNAVKSIYFFAFRYVTFSITAWVNIFGKMKEIMAVTPSRSRFRLISSRLILTIYAAGMLALYPAVITAAGSIKAAVAANFLLPFNEIAAAFESETGVKVEGTFSSTGNLYAQAISGAPYDIFLSADEQTPGKLYEQGLSEKPFIYATGRAVLWGEGKFCSAKGWQEALRMRGIRKIALANPATAPYGTAAEAALKKSGLWDEVSERLVTAQNVGQAFQYAVTGGTDMSFCALSSALSERGRKGCYYLIEEALPIRQSACLVKRSTAKKDALLFLKYLASPRALEIKKRYGYI
jgi:molybdate transport system substrate-binding protein